MRILQRLRVPIGFGVGIIILYFAAPLLSTFLLGWGIASLGLLIRVWASGHLDKFQALTVTGPYRYTRNPLYLGSFIMGIGLCVVANNPVLTLGFLVVFASVYFPVMRAEERELEQSYSSQFEPFRRSVPLFLPKLPISTEPLPENKRAFCWERFRSNKEIRAILGFLIFFVATLIKLLWS